MLDGTVSEFPENSKFNKKEIVLVFQSSSACLKLSFLLIQFFQKWQTLKNRLQYSANIKLQGNKEGNEF